MVRSAKVFGAALVAWGALGACDSEGSRSESVGGSMPTGRGEAGAAGFTNAFGSGGTSSGGRNGEVGNESSIPGQLSGIGAAPSANGGTSSTEGAAGAGLDASPDGAAEVSGTLTFYFVDSEGGQSTVVQLPNGQILVIDTGNAGMRDGERMLALLEGELGKGSIDYLLTTHYDSDHVGGVPYLAARMRIDQYFDHGNGGAPMQYLALANASERRSLVAGDALSLGGVSVQVVSAAGTVIGEPLPGAGLPNPFCDGAQAALPGDPLDENVNSVGVVIRFGEFDFLDLGDLLWPREHELACPDLEIGPIDVYLTTHHGLTRSCAPQLVRGIEPLAAIMNNGPRKGGGGSTWNTLALAPGAANVWQVHRAVTAPAAENAPPDQIANLDEGQGDAANYLKLTVEASGQFSIENPRTSFQKTYTSR